VTGLSKTVLGSLEQKKRAQILSEILNFPMKTTVKKITFKVPENG
jgi:hypothetical protein